MLLDQSAPAATTLRAKLVVLAAITIVPLSIFATSVVLWSLYEGRQTAQLGLDQTTQALSVAVDEKIITWKAALTALSVSPTLDLGNYALFREQAIAVTKEYGGWLALSLPSGQQVVNTSVRNDIKLPFSSERALPDEVLVAGKSHVSNIFWGPATHRSIVAITVPATRLGHVTHVLHIGVPPEELAKWLAEQELPPAWSAALIDGDGKLLAYVPLERNLTGSTLPHWILQSTQTSPSDGELRGQWLNGKQVYGTFQHLSQAPWTLALVAPEAELAQAWLRPLVVLGLGGAVLIIVTCAAFIAIGRQLANPINGLAKAARDAMQDKPLKWGSVPDIFELMELRDAVIALSQKQILLREASHRIKNGLQLVSSSLALQAKASKHEEMKEEFLAAQSHIDAVARLHERLYQTDQYEYVEAFALIRSVCDDISLASARRASVRVDTQGAATLSSSNAGPFVLIIAELVTNAVKHVLCNGEIYVKCRSDDRANILVTISNQGSMLPPDFDLSAHPGLGLKMCLALARQIGGTLRTVPSNESATFELRVPASRPSSSRDEDPQVALDADRG